MSAARPIMIAAGGTGGHIFPGLAVADVLRTRNVPVLWVGTEQGMESTIIPPTGIAMRCVDVAGLRGKNLLQTLTGPLRLLRACWQCVSMIRQERPAAVLGMGGFVSGPVGIAAIVLRCPLVLHEQNAVAGMTNRYLARFATRVFSAMPDVFSSAVAARVVGNPVRSTLSQTPAPSVSELDEHRPMNILVVGGSRGARALNTIVPEAVAQLEQTCAIHHQSGAADLSTVQAAYEHYPSARVEPFIEDMSAAYAWADLVICRAGAMTVTELTAAGRASILVPFPHAVDDHQTRNARFLSDQGAALLIPQQQLDSSSLAQQLRELQSSPERYRHMADKARALFRADAAETVAAALLEISR